MLRCRWMYCFRNLFSCELRYQFHKLYISIYLVASVNLVLIVPKSRYVCLSNILSSMHFAPFAHHSLPIYINKFHGLCPKITKMRLSNPFIIKLTKPNGSVLIVIIELQIFRNHLFSNKFTPIHFDFRLFLFSICFGVWFVR